MEGPGTADTSDPAQHPSTRKPPAIGTDEDTVGLVRRLTAHYPDAKIAWIPNWQGRKHAWHGREIPLEPARWPLIADGAPTPHQHAEARDLLAALREDSGSRLTAHQRGVLVAIALSDVPIDILAEQLNTTRGSLYGYKTLQDARQKLRAALAARGRGIDGDEHRWGRAGRGAVIENVSDDARRLAERLVGPAEPELGCEECCKALDTYLELELAREDADAQMPRMRAHLQAARPAAVITTACSLGCCTIPKTGDRRSCQPRQFYPAR